MEANGASKHHSSIIVPSVQEMVKEKLIKKVPQRYVRSDLNKAEMACDSGLKPEIPVIDMSRLCSLTTMDSEIEKLDLACKEWGFFQVSFKSQSFTILKSFFTKTTPLLVSYLQLVNHGVDSGFLDKFKSQIQDFFNLPMEEKKKLWQKPGDIEGFGQAFVVSEEQKLDWADMFHLTVLPARFRKPHVFPKIPLPLRFASKPFLLASQVFLCS